MWCKSNRNYTSTGLNIRVCRRKIKAINAFIIKRILHCKSNANCFRMYYIMDVLTVLCGTRENQFKLSQENDRKFNDLDPTRIVINLKDRIKQKQWHIKLMLSCKMCCLHHSCSVHKSSNRFRRFCMRADQVKWKRAKHWWHSSQSINVRCVLLSRAYSQFKRWSQSEIQMTTNRKVQYTDEGKRRRCRSRRNKWDRHTKTSCNWEYVCTHVTFHLWWIFM